MSPKASKSLAASNRHRQPGPPISVVERNVGSVTDRAYGFWFGSDQQEVAAR